MLKRTIALGTGALLMVGAIGVTPVFAQQAVTTTVSGEINDNPTIMAYLERVIALLRQEIALLTDTSPIENGLSASPPSGVAPLATTFTVSGESGDYSMDFGDGTSGTMHVDPTFAACGSHCPYSAAHTYQKAGTYTASASYRPQCPAGMLCAQYVRFVGSTTITVTATDTPPSSESIQSFSVPASITLKTSGIAEDKRDGFYVTLTALDSDSATISVVNPYCAGWPSDPPGTIHCMIAVRPIVLTLGTGASGTFQSGSATYAATATAIGTDQATFSFTKSE